MAALSEIQKLEARFAENPDGRFFAPLADAYRKAGDPDRALEVIQGNLAKHPDYLSAHIVLGRCYLDKKDDAGATRAFERVLELDSENIIALKSLAEIAERVGQPDEARRWLMRLLTVDQMNSEAEEDLKRLGGPIAEAGAEEPAAEVSPPHISFADLTEPELPPEPVPPVPPVEVARMAEESTVPVPAIPDEPPVPKTLERLAVRAPVPPSLAMTEEKTLGFPPVPPPVVEPPRAEAPPAPEPLPVTVQQPAIMPMMDLEPTSYQTPEPEPAPEPEISVEVNALDRKETRQRVSESEYEGFGVAPTQDADATAIPPLVLDAPMEPPTVSTHEEPEPAGLPLIMPEDVTPPEEMRRPSHKQIQVVAPDEAPAAAEAAGAPLVTETMGDLYLQQGLRQQAADVYRQLLSGRPDDASLKAKLAAIESPQALSAAALGTEAVGSWLRRIARSALPTGSPPAPPEPTAEPSPMDQAFSEPEPAPSAADAAGAGGAAGAEGAGAAASPEKPAGEPARPASTAFSLDQIFGGGQAGGAASAPPPPKHALGASFDEFFGATPAGGESARPKESEAPKTGGDDDLSAFNAWLHGLKS